MLSINMALLTEGGLARRSRLIRWTHVVGVDFDNLEPRDFERVLGLGVSLSAMDVYRFVPFIGLEEEPPAENH